MLKLSSISILVLLAKLALSQCPVTSPNSNLSNLDAGSPACDAGGIYEYQGEVSNTASCFVFSGSSCGIAYYGDTYSLTCDFCVSFDFTLSTLTSDGIAFSIVDFSSAYNDNPCQQVVGCGPGGNIGYNELNNDASNLGGGAPTDGGALTIEFDVFDNISFGDADEPSTGAGFCPHIAIHEDGDNNSFEAFACIPDLNDGNTHSANICWNPSTNTLTVEYDGSTVITLNSDIAADYFPSGNTDVHFAFSSGYNGSFIGSNQVCNWDVQPIPITLNNHAVQLEGHNDNGNNLLNWKDINSLNSKYVVEKSSNGNNFEPISGIIYSNNETEFTFVDNNSNYNPVTYRIKRTDENNNITFSNSLLLLPNKDELNIYQAGNMVNAIHNEGGLAGLKLFNSAGQCIKLEELEGSLSWDLSNLPTGIYFIIGTTEFRTIRKKIFIE